MNIAFFLSKLFATFIAALPFRLMYVVSGLLTFTLKYIFRYRKKVILKNLQNSFPEKSISEIKNIASDYYRNLSDIILEVFKLQRISPEELKKRFEFDNYQLLASALDNQKSVIIAIGHCGNWEWMGTALGLITEQKGFALTKPLSDKNFNAFIEMVRHRLNPDSTIPFKSAFREMVRRKNKPSFYVLAADQTPTMDEASFWITFLNQETPFFVGIEKIAQSLDTCVIFMDIQRIGRGKYRGELKLISDQPKDTREGEITHRYVELLEEAIRRNPSNWLWSHRRWKHNRHSTE